MTPDLGIGTVEKTEGERRPLRILQVNTLHGRGGAAEVAWNLHQAYRDRGIDSWMAVKRMEGIEPSVILIPNDRRGRLPTRLLRRWDRLKGREDYRFAGTWRLLDLLPEPPDLVHCHNLHGGYFDLRVLPWLSRQVPVALTLHDAWLLSGHCAHSFGCGRWETGCGTCPDLTIYPAIRRDGTAGNWRRKRATYKKSQCWVSTPSKWLMDRVERSMLMPAIREHRVIPNGVDLSVYKPSDRLAARRELGIPVDAAVLLFASDGIRTSPWRDWGLLREAVTRAAGRLERRNLLLLGLGEEALHERIGRVIVRCDGYRHEPSVVARYFQAADLYVHPARADTFPTAILQALACGTPVLATAVGGIPEQVKLLSSEGSRGVVNSRPSDEASGVLVKPNDLSSMADALVMLLSTKGLLEVLGKNAARDARLRFDLKRHVKDTLDWYGQILGREEARVQASGGRDRQPFPPEASFRESYGP